MTVPMVNNEPPPPPYRLLVCGDRNWDDASLIRTVLEVIKPENIEILIHGSCRGADLLASHCAQTLDIKHRAYPANWVRYGKGAGPMRNQHMLKYGRPNYVIAFHDNIENSRGTRDMVQRARAAGIYTFIFSHTKGIP